MQHERVGRCVTARVVPIRPAEQPQAPTPADLDLSRLLMAKAAGLLRQLDAEGARVDRAIEHALSVESNFEGITVRVRVEPARP